MDNKFVYSVVWNGLLAIGGLLIQRVFLDFCELNMVISYNKMRSSNRNTILNSFAAHSAVSVYGVSYLF